MSTAVLTFLSPPRRNEGTFSRIHQRCLCHNDSAHHHLRERREPQPSLQRGRAQPQVLPSAGRTARPGGEPQVSVAAPDHSAGSPAAEYASYSVWGGRGWGKQEEQAGRETGGAHSRRRVLKRRKTVCGNLITTTVCTHTTARSITSFQRPPLLFEWTVTMLRWTEN